MIIDRSILYSIKNILNGEPRIVVLYGPRQAGKSFLITQLLEEEKRRTLVFNGEDLLTQQLFSVPILDRLESIVGNSEVLVIDEAQKIENIGTSLKLLFDHKPRHILVSGSSSFDLANKLAEAMTGRATYFTLFPVSVPELSQELIPFGLENRLSELLVYGMYPKVQTLTNNEQKQQYLYDIINTYLYKDLLAFENIRKPKKVIDLLSLLAFQIGSEVSIQELAQNLAISKVVIEKYLDVLEKMFVVVNLRGFSRNLRKEITKTSKYYFVDLGVRNAIIRNFNPFNLRDDIGSCFENFCVIERMKLLSNGRKMANFYFWRTYDQKEIDLIEERDGKLRAFEFKYGDGKISKATKSEFLETYSNSEFNLITPKNLPDFLN